MPQRVRVNRDDPRRGAGPFVNLVTKTLPEVDVPNGCLYPEGQEGDQGPTFFQQGTGGQQTLGENTRYGMGSGMMRKTYDGNRSGE